tara:strand:- start:452 stop:1240 length:789 start_codon:yes stop_codon:yes gene_type:complete
MPAKKQSKSKGVSSAKKTAGRKAKPKTKSKTPKPKKRIKKPSFEESILEIDSEIKKRRYKWNLSALSWMDFSDVSQILRIHIYKKWDMYDPSKPLKPWINRIISNQIKNLIRNNYGNYARPCLKCSASEGENFCVIYGKQDSSCPLYSMWEKTKKKAYDAKLPVSLEDHQHEIFTSSNKDLNVEKISKQLHAKMKQILKPVEWNVYECLYIKFLSEEETAKKIGYRTSEKNRSPGYKQIKNIKKAIIQKVKKVLEKGEVDFL